MSKTMLALLALILLIGNSASAATPIPLPEHDPFYSYSGPLSQIPPGTPLRERSVTLGAMTNDTPLPAEQVLYRTTDASGRPATSVTTFALPATGTVAPKVIAYLSFYDAFTSKCSPSYTLRGGDSGAPSAQQAEAEQAVVHFLRTHGYVVTVPDFENRALDFMAGTEAGMSSLDAVKATLAVLKLGASTPVGMVGYSGGSMAADWAAELAPRYAPQVNLVGVAGGGIPVNLAHILRYVDGTPSWSKVIPAVLVGMARANHFDLTPYLSPYGLKLTQAVARECIGEFPGNLTIKQLLKPQYADVVHVPAFKRALDAQVMGSAPGHPTAPLFMVAGNLDGTGDGVTIAADQKALAQQYCAQGVPVVFQEVQHGEHTQAGFVFMPAAFDFLAARFAGAPPVNGCAAIR